MERRTESRKMKKDYFKYCDAYVILTRQGAVLTSGDARLTSEEDRLLSEINRRIAERSKKGGKTK